MSCQADSQTLNLNILSRTCCPVLILITSYSGMRYVVLQVLPNLVPFSSKLNSNVSAPALSRLGIRSKKKVAAVSYGLHSRLM